MGGGVHSGSRLAKYCSEKNFATSFQSFNTCYKVVEQSLSFFFLLSTKKCT